MTDNTPVRKTEPSRFICNKCNITYAMGKETTVYVYRKQVWFNHLDTICPKCHRDYTLWYITPAAVTYMTNNNMENPEDMLGWKYADYCDDMTVIRRFCLDNNKPVPRDNWLSTRAYRVIDTQVAWFAYLLDHGEIERNF